MRNKIPSNPIDLSYSIEYDKESKTFNVWDISEGRAATYEACTSTEGEALAILLEEPKVKKSRFLDISRDHRGRLLLSTNTTT